MSALCVGKHWLFDSTDPIDHDQAAKLCAACPLLADCQIEASRLSREYRTSAYRPLTGTWGGRLYGTPGRAPRVTPREEQMFTEDDALQAHRDWGKGIRNDRARIGERVYQRRRYVARKETA